MASDGWRFVLPTLGAGILLLVLSPRWGQVLGGVLLFLSLFCAFFFRDFDRVIKKDDDLIYSPGDGRVMEVRRVEEGPNQGALFIRIFLSVFNVHVQRAPVAGRVEKIEYVRGVFLDARHPEAHKKNERNAVTLSHAKGLVKVTQVAGLIARRIVCHISEGTRLEQGERYGLIRFGSQVDVEIQGPSVPVVQVGDPVRAGLTVLARWENK